MAWLEHSGAQGIMGAFWMEVGAFGRARSYARDGPFNSIHEEVKKWLSPADIIFMGLFFSAEISKFYINRQFISVGLQRWRVSQSSLAKEINRSKESQNLLI